MLNIKNKVFIYPTDTIYGIGCDATNPKLVKKIRLIKQRDEKPFSIIAPNKKWIFDNFIVSKKAKLLIDKKLPGKFTFILKVKDKKSTLIALKEIAGELDTVGVRIPKHWFSKDLEVPIVTTSVNISGQPNMTSIEDCDKSILSAVDFVLYEGKKEGKPSILIIAVDDNIKIIKR
ncbi:MAG: L-threonylcarbamoyladenylate synthase [Candidatus Woesearchaeota archaeon]|jgi:L-threonylcarbamoyladenylate synthase